MLRLWPLLLLLIGPARVTAADGELSAFGRLLNASLPESRLPGIIEFVGTRGTTADLGLLLEKTVDPDGFPTSVRPAALAALEKSFAERNLKPTGDLARIGVLVTDEALDPGLRVVAIRLAGAWRVSKLTESLVARATEKTSAVALRDAAIEALATIGGERSRTALRSLTDGTRPLATRYAAAAGLVAFDVDAAAPIAAEVLADGSGEIDPAPVLAAFLERPGASDKLAAALEAVELRTDQAKLALRYVYSVGRNDPRLAGVLSDAAGISTKPITLTPDELKTFTTDVLEQGDPRRGEAVFRRRDLSCLKCHALRGAGGRVGPELTVVGASSPVDYLTRAVLDPDKDVKEEYRTAIVITEEGKAFHGVVANETEETLVLKEASGRLRSLPKETLEEREEGGSLMPKGLAGFMTRGELVDLVRFLSELGRPGTDYAPRNDPTFHRWRFAAKPPQAVTEDVPNDESFSAAVHEAMLTWTEFYARHDGGLPLDELSGPVTGDVVLLKAEFDVTTAGAIGVRVRAPENTTVWIDGDSFDAVSTIVTELDEGRHTLYLRVARGTASSSEAGARLETVPDSAGRAVVVGGP